MGYKIRGVVISVRQAWSTIRGIECGELAMETQQSMYGALGEFSERAGLADHVCFYLLTNRYLRGREACLNMSAISTWISVTNAM
jgi:hypothetical protein